MRAYHTTALLYAFMAAIRHQNIDEEDAQGILDNAESTFQSILSGKHPKFSGSEPAVVALNDDVLKMIECATPGATPTGEHGYHE